MCLDLAEHVEPRHIRQREVQQQHVAGRSPQHRERFATGLGLTRPGEIRLRFENLLQADANELVSVDDGNTGSGHVSRLRRRNWAGKDYYGSEGAKEGAQGIM